MTHTPHPIAAAASAAPWPSAARGWWGVGVFCITAILSYSDRQILTLLVDSIRADLHTSDVQIGLLQGAAFALIYAVAGVALGRAADVLPRRAVIVAGILIWSTATVLCGCAASFGGLFAARAVVGIGEAALAPAAMSIITDSFPAHRRGAGTGAFLMGMIIGSGVALAADGMLLHIAEAGALKDLPIIGTMTPWRACLVIQGLAGLPIALVAATVHEPLRRRVGAGSAEPAPIREAAGQLASMWKTLLPLYAAMGMNSLCDFAILNWVPAMLTRRFHTGVAEIGSLLGIAVIAGGILGSIGAGVVADLMVRRGGGASRLRLAVFAAIIGCLATLLVFAPNAPAAAALAGLWIFASTSGQTVGITVVQEIAPNDTRGLSISLVSLVNIGIGLALGAALPALVMEHVLHSSTAVGAAVTLVALPFSIVSVGLYVVALRSGRKIGRDLA